MLYIVNYFPCVYIWLSVNGAQLKHRVRTRNSADIFYVNFVPSLATLDDLMMAILTINPRRTTFKGTRAPHRKLTWRHKLTSPLHRSTSIVPPTHTRTLADDDTKVPLALLKVS